MKFGKVSNPETIDLTLPQDSFGPSVVFAGKNLQHPNIYVGCAKWNRADLKNFYPRGTKDELAYYSTQFNCIELNATFYRFFPPEQFEKWKEKTPGGFKFFPKITQDISHFKRLNNVEKLVEEYLHAATRLEEKLGMVFLQLHNNFSPKDFERVERFIEGWPKGIPLAIEFRHTDWYNNPEISAKLYKLLEGNNISNIIVDTAGRRDLLHMHLTSPQAFVRYVGANHPTDYMRLDDWVHRVKQWVAQGIEDIYFFVHQNMEVESPLLSKYFIEKLNKEIGTDLKAPQVLPPK